MNNYLLAVGFVEPKNGSLPISGHYTLLSNCPLGQQSFRPIDTYSIQDT